MATCKVCGNKYDQSSELWLRGEIQVIDSFECAFYDRAPRCAHCDGRITKQGIEVAGILFCCAHCAREHEALELQAPTYEYSIDNVSYALGERFVSAGE